ncbi:DUF1800 domain-containing protein [Miltoncostaea oceani]|uniref:DUF1800 domain-containing protein n=1 Tax=Miltoncostaea oceani TaxID=2843216 RepID=UPI001C3C324D|nr:DUF1800 domain-containing protein [Miltoncostaea oceani]
MAGSADRARAERLTWRAGFGPRPGEVDDLARRGVAGAVEHLLAPRGRALAGRPARVDGAPLDPVNAYGHDVLWWLDRAVRTRHPLVERMTFNWHDHFATSNDGVGDTRLMLAQYWTLRRGALGRFRDLARAITRDRAMQLFLSLANSEKGHPNENFARELLELFTLGVNNGYTERDVREAARALTGFTFDYESRRFGFDPDRHDPGVKRIMGRVGRFQPLDVVDIAVEHKAHPAFICGKLWDYFSPRPCPPSLLRSLARTYRTAKTDVRPVLREILTHKLFYASLAEPDMVKSPFVYTAGMLRMTGGRVDDESWVYRLDQMGQVPFHPPNVSGWEGGTSWLSTSSIRARFDAATAVLRDTIEDGSISAKQTPAQALRSAMAATGSPRVGPRTRRALQSYAVSSVKGRTDDWEVEHFFPERQRVLRHLLLAGPDAQVC